MAVGRSFAPLRGAHKLLVAYVYNVLEVYFYEAISKWKIQHTKKTYSLKYIAGASYKSVHW